MNAIDKAIDRVSHEIFLATLGLHQENLPQLEKNLLRLRQERAALFQQQVERWEQERVVQTVKPRVWEPVAMSCDEWISDGRRLMVQNCEAP